MRKLIFPIFTVLTFTISATQPLHANQDQPKLLEFKEVEWIDLMPEEDFEALMNPPDYISDIVEGSEEDQLRNLGEGNDFFDDDPYQQALTSTKIVEEMDGKAIRIPGFMVPLEWDDNQSVLQFFLVPFLGACIHVPPPPPNQVIHVTTSTAIETWDLYTPFWISGVIQTSYIENDIAAATYAMELQSIEVYED